MITENADKLLDFLGNYPDTVSTLRLRALDAAESVRAARMALTDLEADFKSEVYSDPLYKNADQRNAALATKKAEPLYLAALELLHSEERALALTEIELERIRNHFAVIKIALDLALSLKSE